jgi:3-deoxy-D-manno-octulosonate 8-phosphate phosphatase (KDO 8-P phosphatase)
MKTNSNYKERLAGITTFIFDVDGVFTSGEIYFHLDDVTIRSLNAKDGYALESAVKKGFRVAAITRGDSQLVKSTFAKVGVQDVFLGIMNKGKVFDEYLKTHKLANEEVLYMGDDIPDYDCVKNAGIGTSPRDAVKEIREIADYVSTFDGGKGAVRDVVEQTMRVQGKWFVPTV